MLRRAADLVPTPWRNGQGMTRDVLTRRDAAGALLWQASIAELTADCDFSDYAGFDRVFTPLAGEVALSHDGSPFQPCPALRPHPFPGEARTRCRVTAPGRAFNIIVARGGASAAVEIRNVTAGAAVGGRVVYLCSGRLTWAGTDVHPGDSLIEVEAVAAVPSVVLIA